MKRLCESEVWHDGQKRVIRCELDEGHDGLHSRMTEFWGIAWPDEQAFERSRYLSGEEIAQIYGRPIGTIRRLASENEWKRTADKHRPVLYRVLDVEKTMDALIARNADKRAT